MRKKSDIEKGMKIVNESKKVIKEKNLDVEELFENFDKDKSGTLDKKEIFRLLKVIKEDVNS